MYSPRYSIREDTRRVGCLRVLISHSALTVRRGYLHRSRFFSFLTGDDMSLRKNAFERAEAAAYSVRVFVEGMRCHQAALSRMQNCAASKVGVLKRVYDKLDWRDRQAFKGLLRRAAATLIGDEREILLGIVEEKRKRGRPKVNLPKVGPGRPRKLV